MATDRNVRIAAVGDVHVAEDCAGCLDLAQVDDCADMLLLAGDLTRVGDPSEAKVLADELAAVQVPIVAVLGNHDYHSDRQPEVSDCLSQAGVTILEGDTAIINVDGCSVGIAGAKGFGGGFTGACGSDFGEPEMKAFVRHTKTIAARLEEQLSELETGLRIALLHYAPVESTLEGERLEIYPFLGSYLLGEAVDRVGADLILHGHAHHGTEKGVTPGGIRVRNVAKPVIGHPFNVYHLGVTEDAVQPAMA